MLGICPNCSIRLKDPPFNDRVTNEVMLVIKYRGIVESGKFPKTINELGYCELCNAKKEDIDLQSKLT
jgi:hypothetical protein